MARRPSALLSIAAIAWLWVGAILTAPAWTGSAAIGSPAPPRTAAIASAAIYSIGALICHQRPERSFHVAGAQLPVCARCTGLYVGGALGVFAWVALAGMRRAPSRRAAPLTSTPVARRTLIAAAIPTAITVAAALVGLWDPGNVVRALLAIPLGASIGAVVSAVAAGDLR